MRACISVYCTGPERILPLYNVNAGFSEGVIESEEEEGSGGARVTPCRLHLLQLIPLLPLQLLFVHDERRQRSHRRLTAGRHTVLPRTKLLNPGKIRPLL